ncbi:hypothetical protein B0J15DRAFT_410227, partial [Fusarium solani]
EVLYNSLIFSIKPNINLLKIKDNIASLESGYYFIEHLGNSLKLIYLDLLI